MEDRPWFPQLIMSNLIQSFLMGSTLSLYVLSAQGAVQYLFIFDFILCPSQSMVDRFREINEVTKYKFWKRRLKYCLFSFFIFLKSIIDDDMTIWSSQKWWLLALRTLCFLYPHHIQNHALWTGTYHHHALFSSFLMEWSKRMNEWSR